MKNDIQSVSKKLVKAYNSNKLINPIPEKFCKNIKLAHKLRLLCESKITVSYTHLTLPTNREV